MNNRTFKVLTALTVLTIAAVLFNGCAHLAPGADPIEVRAEQSEQLAQATFDTFEKLDDQNWAFLEKNAKGVNDFAEWLRTPVGSPPEPRGIAMIESFSHVRQAYKTNRSAENKATLITALATLEQAITETQQQIANIKKE